MMPTIRPFSSVLRSRVVARPAPSMAVRSYRQTAAQRRPYKDDQDRESLKPRANEETKSSSDENIAAQEDAAFDPNKTDPHNAKAKAGEGADGNPLEVSGANQDISKPPGEGDKKKTSGGSRQGKQKASGGGNQQKKGRIDPNQ